MPISRFALLPDTDLLAEVKESCRPPDCQLIADGVVFVGSDGASLFLFVKTKFVQLFEKRTAAISRAMGVEVVLLWSDWNGQG